MCFQSFLEILRNNLIAQYFLVIFRLRTPPQVWTHISGNRDKILVLDKQQKFGLIYEKLLLKLKILLLARKCENEVFLKTYIFEREMFVK